VGTKLIDRREVRLLACGQDTKGDVLDARPRDAP
jgi:hypothetical protein